MANEFFKSLTINVNANATDMNVSGERFNDGFEGVVTVEDNGEVQLAVNPTADPLNVIYRSADVSKQPKDVVADLAEVVTEYKGFVSPYVAAAADFTKSKSETKTDAKPAETTESNKEEAKPAETAAAASTGAAPTAATTSTQNEKSESTTSTPASNQASGTESKTEEKPAESNTTTAASPFSAKPFGQ